MSEGFTCSVWFKMRNLTNGASTPIFDKDGGNDRWYLRIRDDSSDTIQFNFGDGSGTTDITGSALTDNDWHHCVVTLATSGSAWTSGILYLDGASVTTTDISARNADTPGDDPLTIAADGTSAELAGAVAMPKIYARALAADEVKLLYQSGARVIRSL